MQNYKKLVVWQKADALAFNVYKIASSGFSVGNEMSPFAKEGNPHKSLKNQLKKRWRGRFRDEKTTDEYIDEIRGKAN